MRRLTGTQSGNANAFARLLAGEVAALDPAWLIRHGLAPYAVALGAKHPLLRRALATELAQVGREAIAEVLHALRGLDVIGLKGLDYARRLYPDPALRPMGDHDLLVRPFEEALARLKRIGFQEALVQRGVARHRAHYAVQLVRNGYQLDVHRAVRQEVRARVPYDALFARATRDGDIAWLEPVDRLLVHCMHLAGHECLGPLIHYLDLELLLAETPLSDEVMSRARAWRVAHALQGALFVRARLRGWRAPVFLGGVLLPDAEAVSSRRRPARPLQLMRKALLMDGPAELMRFLLYSAESLRRPYRS